jgi:hypothetical protein
MAHHRGRSQNMDEESSYLEPVEGERCRVCRQEYSDGICPIASAVCPYLKEEDAADDDDQEDPDFDDVENLDSVLGEDREADRLTEEEAELPPEDLRE